MSSFRTAESVSPKHPDKLCDQVSDAILDAYLSNDSNARCAVEAAGGHGKIFITGEVASKSHPKLEPIIRRIVGGGISVEINLARQSNEISQGVDGGGAGDQGIMVGYACDETPEHLPLEVVLARNLNQYLYKLWPFDGKTQITLKGGEIHSIVASFQNAPRQKLELAVKDWASKQSYTSKCFVRGRNSNPALHINPAGDWQSGGFDADAGLTGRKLVVDNYGPRIPIGGGCFSGKDASKVDRSAAYMARKIALDYLSKRKASEVYCYLAYAIGYDQPVEATVTVNGLQETIADYDLSPIAIADTLQLKRPQFEETARYGHFGYNKFSWEQID